LITSPLLILIAIGIKFTSSGPIIFKQERVGLGRRKFMIYKFRTMKVVSDDSSNTKWTMENDPRRTKFGTFLRKTSLDELPQFFNVLFGHMSVVGPRPERPYFVEQFKEEIPKYMVKHHIRPGITGWAQSNGLRGDTSIEDRIKHDIFYIENWSFLFDIKIIWKTILNGFFNKNAY
jgi:exopolysaccharide biosynthesis polyprenyl glycosylphosphotransferase